MVYTPEVEDFLLDLNRRSVRMPFWDWWAVYETIFAILLLGPTPAIKASPANPKITACLCYMPGLLSVSKNAQLALNLALLVVYEHLLPPKIKKLMKMFREYRHIYSLEITSYSSVILFHLLFQSVYHSINPEPINRSESQSFKQWAASSNE